MSVDGTLYTLGPRDLLYVGRGSPKHRVLQRATPAVPAQFYLVSYPAHATYPTALMRFNEAERSPLGSARTANQRTICKYVHAGGIKSCQLVMGMTAARGRKRLEHHASAHPPAPVGSVPVF